jgi:O-antigen/teichoic acid export membrane protein
MRSLVFIALGWLLPIVVFLLATPVLVAHFGFAGFGVFALAGTLVMAGASIDLGFATLAVRQLARSRGDVDAFHRQAAGFNTVFLCLAACAALLVWIFSDTIVRSLNWEQALPQAEAVTTTRWTGLWLALAFINVGLASGLRAIERFDLIALLGTGAAVATWGAAAVGAKWGLGPVAAVALAAGVAALQMVFSAGVQAMIFGRWPRLGRWPNFEPGAARFAGSALVSQATSLATYHADKAIVSALLGATPAGMYVAAANIANKPLAFVAALAGILFPRIAALESQGRSFRSTRTYLAASRMLVAASTLLITCVVVLADDFIRLWLGNSVPDSVTTSFRILLVAYWIATLSVAPSNALAGKGNAHRGATFALAGGVVTLVGCVILVPPFGLVGAAIAALLGMSQAAIFELWAHHEAQSRHRFARFGLRRTIFALAICASGAAITAAIVSSALVTSWPALFAAALAGSLVFVALWFGLGLAAREERAVLGRVLRLVRMRR